MIADVKKLMPLKNFSIKVAFLRLVYWLQKTFTVSVNDKWNLFLIITVFKFDDTLFRKDDLSAFHLLTICFMVNQFYLANKTMSAPITDMVSMTITGKFIINKSRQICCTYIMKI